MLLRYSANGGQTFSPVESVLGFKAYTPDVAVSPTGEFVVVWHEEQFPLTKTVIQTIQLHDGKYEEGELYELSTFNKVLDVTLTAPVRPNQRVTVAKSQPVYIHDTTRSSIPTGALQEIAMLVHSTFLPWQLRPHS